MPNNGDYSQAPLPDALGLIYTISPVPGGFQWDPPRGSEKLANVLEYNFPTGETLIERMRMAMLEKGMIPRAGSWPKSSRESSSASSFPENVASLSPHTINGNTSTKACKVHSRQKRRCDPACPDRRPIAKRQHIMLQEAIYAPPISSMDVSSSNSNFQPSAEPNNPNHEHGYADDYYYGAIRNENQQAPASNNHDVDMPWLGISGVTLQGESTDFSLSIDPNDPDLVGVSQPGGRGLMRDDWNPDTTRDLADRLDKKPEVQSGHTCETKSGRKQKLWFIRLVPRRLIWR